jgi:hypothetical protein
MPYATQYLDRRQPHNAVPTNPPKLAACKGWTGGLEIDRRGWCGASGSSVYEKEPRIEKEHREVYATSP